MEDIDTANDDQPGLLDSDSVEPTSRKTIKTASKVAPFLETLVGAHTKKYGDRNIFTGTTSKIIGLEPYALALQYLMAIDVLPMQSIVVLSGEPKTYKTSAMLEMCRLALDDGGLGVVINTEGKWSATKVKSLLGDSSVNLIVNSASSVEEWQSMATNYLNTLKDAVDGKKEAILKRAKSSKFYDMEIPPVVIGVDSLIGAQSENVAGQVIKDGHGKKTYQDRALINTQWLTTWSSKLVGIPATVVITNHLKDKIDQTATYGDKKSTAGGSAQDFFATINFRVSVQKRIQSASGLQVNLQWRTHNSSVGPDKRKCVFPYYETYEESDDGPINQIAYYDWDQALVLLLIDLMDGKDSSLRETILKVTGKITEYAKPGFGKVYSCEALGIDKKMAMDEKITAQVLGKRLQSWESDLRPSLKRALRITECEKWTSDKLL